MATPTFSVGVDADPMLVEQTIGKTLDQIIKERKEKQGVGASRGKKAAAAGGRKDPAKKKAEQVAKSVGTSKAKREAALAKKRGILESSKPLPAQIDAQVQRTKGKQAKKKALKDVEALVAGSKGASKAKARKKRDITAKTAAAAGGVKKEKGSKTAAQDMRGGPRPGGKKQGAGPGGPGKQAALNAGGKGFNVGVKGEKRSQQLLQQAPTGRRTRRRRGDGSGSGGGAGGVEDTRTMIAAQPSNAKNAKKSKRKNRAADAGGADGASSTTFTFTPDRNLKISFLSDSGRSGGKGRSGGGGSGGRGGSSGGNYPGSYAYSSPNGVGSRSSYASRSSRPQAQTQPRSALGAISSASAFASSPPLFDNGLHNGGGGGGGKGKVRYTPHPRMVSGGGSRRAGLKDIRRPQTHPMDRVVSTARNSRASTIDTRRRNRQGGSFNGGSGSGSGGRGRNDGAPRRVIIVGNGY